MKRRLHIISLDIPSPPLRGHTIGIFNRIKALSEAGIEIILHAYYKDFRMPGPELLSYCTSIHYYQRKKNWKILSPLFPLYVQSRRDEGLFAILDADQAPILFEGLHTCYHFEDARIKNRKKYIRMHNIESDYYDQLYKTEMHPFKKLYYKIESLLSKKLEARILPKAKGVFAINRKDEKMISTNYTEQCLWIPPFHSNSSMINENSKKLGEHALYHGDLSIRENEWAALFLIEKVWSNEMISLVVAGNKPSKKLKSAIAKRTNIKLIESPSDSQMEEIWKETHIVLAPFLHSTGYKMKVLESLNKNKHILTSADKEIYSEWTNLVVFMENDPLFWKEKITELSHTLVSVDQINQRNHFFEIEFSNENSAKQLIQCIWKDH